MFLVGLRRYKIRGVVFISGESIHSTFLNLTIEPKIKCPVSVKMYSRIEVFLQPNKTFDNIKRKAFIIIHE